MFYEIAQFFKIFLVSPLTWMAVTLVAGLTVKSRRWRIGLLAATGAMFLFFTNTALVDAAKRSLSGRYIVPSMQPGKKYDTVIVLGGFAGMNPETGAVTYVNDAADRLWEAVRLWREGRVGRILITGDGTISPVNGYDPEPQFLDYMEEMGVPRNVFIAEKRALNTRQNAEYSIAMLDSLGLTDRDCLLLTSAIHMDRSLKCFAKFGWHPDYYPTSIPSPAIGITHRTFYPRWEAATRWEAIINEVVGKVIYKISGYN